MKQLVIGLQRLSAGILLGVLGACSSDKPTNQASPSVPAPVSSLASATPARPLAQSSPPPAVPAKTYEMALDKATSARSISNSAQSQDDWNLVAAQWQDAIALLKTIPSNSPQAKLAQAKLKEYQSQLAATTRKAKGNFNSTPAASRPETGSASPSTLYGAAGAQRFRVPIRYRVGNTPVVAVTFNGNQTFDMILDTGATGTVITPEMAAALAVIPTQKAIVNTASAKGLVVPVGLVNSAAVGGLVVRDLPVAIAGPQLEIGLLGHNFFGSYDLIIRRNYIEFEAQ